MRRILAKNNSIKIISFFFLLKLDRSKKKILITYKGKCGGVTPEIIFIILVYDSLSWENRGFNWCAYATVCCKIVVFPINLIALKGKLVAAIMARILSVYLTRRLQ